MAANHKAMNGCCGFDHARCADSTRDKAETVSAESSSPSQIAVLMPNHRASTVRTMCAASTFTRASLVADINGESGNASNIFQPRKIRQILGAGSRAFILHQFS